MKKYRIYIITFFALIALSVSICFIPINATRLIPIIEKQVAEDFGIKVHIERLILRLGPALKVKAPTMHVMYEDGQKFAQFDNVKFFVPWSALLKDDVAIKRVYASNLIVKVSSKDKYLPQILKKIEERDFANNPNVFLKKYSFGYYDKDFDRHYNLSGNELTIDKILQFKNYKLSGNGIFSINHKQYITYDLSLVPNFYLQKIENSDFDARSFFEQLISFDFHSDIIADLKINESSDGNKEISGLINIDNISVLDPGRKKPKSFIYLTFLGNKIGVLSNIYTSADKKIYLDGVINNSKKPEIDLKVKTDKIDLANLYKKTKLLIDYSKLKDINSLTGSLIADFNLKGDMNKIKSSGYMKISDASIKASGVDINRIQSEIDFSNNTINILHAIGYVNNAPIHAKGKIDKTIDVDLSMDKVELKHLFPKSFGIQNGIISLTSNISGTLNNIIHNENILIDNFKMINNRNTLSFDTLKFNSNKENVAYINNIFIVPEKTEFIKVPMLKLNVEQEFINIPETNIFMPNSKLKAKAKILDYNNKDITFNANLDGVINSKDLKKLIPYSANFPIKINVNGNKEVQNVIAQILLEKAMFLDEPGIINIDTKMGNNNIKIEDLSILSFSGKFNDNFKSNLKGQKKVIISGLIENLKNPAFKNLRLFIPQAVNITLADTVAQIKGDVFINGKINKPDIVGQITLQNVINQFLQLSSNNVNIDFNKDVAIVNTPLIKIADSSFSLNSTVSTDISKGIFIKNAGIKSKYLNTDTILMYKDQLVKDFNITVDDCKLFSEKALVSLYGSHIYLTALSSDIKLKNNVLSLKNISSELFNGKLAAKMDFNIKDETFDSYIQARGISAAPIFDIIAIKKDSVSGTMDFDTNLSGNLSSKESLNGNIKFEVKNGHIGTLGKLEHLIYAQNVIADNMLRTSLSVITKAITLRDTGLFKYLRGDIAMKDGIANIKMLQSQGPLMSLFIKGEYNPNNDYGKLLVLGRVSDEIMTTLGAFGDLSMNKLLTMLTGEDNNKNLYAVNKEDLDRLPQLPIRNTKEFRTIINGIIEKPSSVILFNWISYTQKDLRQKTINTSDVKVPEFINNLPY